MAKILAKAAGVPPRDVSYSGLKDKWAITRQWFSIHLPGKPDPDLSNLDIPQAESSLEIIQQLRHNRKLRRGTHKANKFVILVRNLDADNQELEERLKLIQKRGVPNYFGPQRFGNKAQNLIEAEKLLKGKITCRNKHKKSLYFSAARSLLFNYVLSVRVDDQSWDQYKEGDVMILDASNSVFIPEKEEESDVINRLAEKALHPTGPLWGQKGLKPVSESGQFEQNCLSATEDICQLLENKGLDHQRRSLRLDVKQLEWEFMNSKTLELSFELLPGCFATSVLRELIK